MSFLVIKNAREIVRKIRKSKFNNVEPESSRSAKYFRGINEKLFASEKAKGKLTINNVMTALVIRKKFFGFTFFASMQRIRTGIRRADEK